METPDLDLDAAICEEMSNSLRRKQDADALKSGQTATAAPVATTTVRKLPVRHRDAESDYFYPVHYMSRTDATSSSSSETDTSSEDEKIIEEFASKYPPSQQLSFLSVARPSTRRREPVDVKQAPTAPAATQPPTDPQTSCPVTAQSTRPPLPSVKGATKEAKRRRARRSVAVNRRSALLRCMRQHKTESNEKATAGASSPLSLGPIWADILPLIVSGFLDLKSVINLRQCCKRLYCKRR